ncbi:MAG: glycoside hydrolase [Halobacteriales archaeon]|nr:glycoside hydrolase [Halobacteriales archaeon]
MARLPALAVLLALLTLLPAVPASELSGPPSDALVPPAPATQVAIPSLPPLPYTPGDEHVFALPGNQDETSIAVNPANPQDIVAGANDNSPGDYHARFYTSLDGGATWTDGIIPSLDSNGYLASGDPAIVFAPDGTAYYAGIGFNRGTNNNKNCVFVARSDDGGLTWLTFFPSQSPSGAMFNDKPYIGMAPDGTLLLSWTLFPGGIGFVQSHDRGATWSPRVGLGGGQFSQPAAGADGERYVVWASGGVQVRRSLDGGATWLPAQVIGDANGISVPVPFRYNNYPSIAVLADGSLAVAFAHQDSVTGADIHLVRSADHGATWSAPEVVTDSPGAQFMPWLAAMPDGTLGVFYADVTLTPLTVNPPGLGAVSQLLWSISIQRPGDAWNAVVVSDVPSFAGAGGAPAGFWGDYQGLGASAAGFDAFWADGRNGRFDGNIDSAWARVAP